MRLSKKEKSSKKRKKYIPTQKNVVLVVAVYVQ